MDKLLVAPSTDPAKTVEAIICYANEIKDFADFLHCDIMDEKFVPNKTYSYDVLKEIDSKTLLPLDVHLMVENPHKVLKQFIKSGANFLTVHFEAYNNKNKLIRDLKQIRKLGALSGLSIKPNTPVLEIIPFLSYCDLVLLMSVEPGKSGQKFIQNTYQKVVELNEIKQNYKANIKIEVDGGINPEISQQLKKFGVDIVVSGSFVYNSKNREEAINNLR